MSEPVAALKLPAVLDLRAAAPLREELLNLRGGDVRIDASEVARMGGLCLQVLLAAAATWTGDGRALIVSGATDAFTDALALAGAPQLGVAA